MFTFSNFLLQKKICFINCFKTDAAACAFKHVNFKANNLVFYIIVVTFLKNVATFQKNVATFQKSVTTFGTIVKVKEPLFKEFWVNT